MRDISGGAAWLAMAAAIAFAPPAAASGEEQYKRTVGLWEVSGSNGVCSAALLKMTDSVVWILVSPDQGNDGGIMMTTPRMLTADKDHWTSVAVNFGDGKATSRPAEVNDDPVGLYIPWKTTTEMAAMPDDFRLTISGQGMTLLDVDLHGFKAAVRTLNECDRVTDKNSMS